MSWYFENGPESDVVVSTRIRFARNLRGYKFTSVADDTELKRVLENFKGNGVVSGLQYIKLDELDELMRMSLVEKHIISRDMLKQKDAAVLLNTAEDVCVMLNEEDHIRIQVLKPGLELESALSDAEKIDEEMKEIEEKNAQYLFLVKNTKKIFELVGMHWCDDIRENKERFLNFKEMFVHNESVPKEDIVCLQRAALSLKEKIKTYEILKNQTIYLKDRNDKIDYVLGFLKGIAEQEEQYSDYADSIEQILIKHKRDGEIISFFDYNEAIKQIKKELDTVEQKIKRIELSAAVQNYENTLKYIGALETNFDSIDEYVDVSKYDSLNAKRKQLIDKIKEKKKSMSQRLINEFNDYLTKIYLESDLTSKFALQDKEHDELKICYNPVSGGIYAEKNNEKGEKETYIPGSMARETAWQILAYMAMFKFLNDNFKGLPVLPVILMDAIEQPFVDQNITEFYNLLKKLSEEIGIQLIIFSKNDSDAFDEAEKINLNIEGLNPFINKISN